MKTNIVKTAGFFILFTGMVAGVSAAGEQKGFGKKDIDRFCDASTSTHRTGFQFDNQRASETVLQLGAGKYSYPGNGALLLFKSNRYLIKLPDGYTGIYGTDGDDLLAHGGIVGGCSKEQLSEAMKKNGLYPEKFKLIKRYN